VLDGVHGVWANHLKDPFEVVCGWLHLDLAASGGSHDAHHIGVARFLTIATVVIGRDCDCLKKLLAPPLAALDAPLGILDGDVE
jgi:hypothetical protein